MDKKTFNLIKNDNAYDKNITENELVSMTKTVIIFKMTAEENVTCLVNNLIHNIYVYYENDKLILHLFDEEKIYNLYDDVKLAYTLCCIKHYYSDLFKKRCYFFIKNMRYDDLEKEHECDVDLEF